MRRIYYIVSLIAALLVAIPSQAQENKGAAQQTKRRSPEASRGERAKDKDKEEATMLLVAGQVSKTEGGHCRCKVIDGNILESRYCLDFYGWIISPEYLRRQVFERYFAMRRVVALDVVGEIFRDGQVAFWCHVNEVVL